MSSGATRLSARVRAGDRFAAASPSADQNQMVATRLREAAQLLELQGASSFRVSAFRSAADTVDNYQRDIFALAREEGAAGLIRLPGIGRGIASAILELAATGRWGRLERLRGDLDPVRRLQAVPGIGPKLAETIHDELHVDSLEGLEAALHDGRLAQLSGMGSRRLAALAASLDAMLRRVRAPTPAPRERPNVATLLAVDRDYRARASAGSLPTIAPRRLNPEHERWLPIMHSERAGWHFTALFSNTARAHELGRTRDWVVIYYYDGDHRESQCTVVSETRGALKGRRVVRGREGECHQHYSSDDGCQR